ncbi:MAG TPA: flagellar basal-body MS-ring/collar protein FliF [Geobacteraceae bacterium]|nr:flagellar basal-body MS-ring/collar protein FliF [Geobacteraceae bacterium]
MPEGLKKIIAPLIALSPAKRWTLAGIVIMSLLAFALLIATANRIDYKPLFSNLSNEDAGEIMKKLKELKVPCRVSDDGKAILVPAGKVYELRMSLASEGLPQGSGIGFEIFDRKNFGMTEFVQKLNYQRALQGELSRTIGQIAGVEQARVHLALPEKSLFKENEKPPTASVVLKMKSARLLGESDVLGIIHLVASSVEGMDPDHITVIDSRGRMLNKPAITDPAGRLASSMMEAQNNYEKSFEDKLQTLLDRVVGPGKSAARVNVTLDYKNLEKYEERYDPQASAVRSEQRSEQKDAVTMPQGVPGVQANLGKTQPLPATPAAGSKNDETKNYEVSRSTSRIVEPAGSLTKISVAVLVDGRYEKTVGKKGAAGPLKYVPRTPEELQKIEALVKSSVGFDTARGDQVTVANIPFQEVAADDEAGGPSWWEAPILTTILKSLLIVAGFLALVFMVLKPMLKILGMERPARSSFEGLGTENGELTGTQRPQLTMSKVNQLELLENVKKDPYQAAQVLQSWLRQETGS